MISGLWHKWLQLGEVAAAEADVGMKEGKEGETVKARKAGERARAPLQAQQLPWELAAQWRRPRQQTAQPPPEPRTPQL